MLGVSVSPPSILRIVTALQRRQWRQPEVLRGNFVADLLVFARNVRRAADERWQEVLALLGARVSVWQGLLQLGSFPIILVWRAGERLPTEVRSSVLLQLRLVDRGRFRAGQVPRLAVVAGLRRLVQHLLHLLLQPNLWKYRVLMAWPQFMFNVLVSVQRRIAIRSL